MEDKKGSKNVLKKHNSTSLYEVMAKKYGNAYVIRWIGENINRIITGYESIAESLNVLDTYIFMPFMKEEELNEILDRIDSTLADNIDEIVAKEVCTPYYPSVLGIDSRFPKFKAAINAKKEVIKDKIFLDCTATFSECFEVSQELYGEINEELIALLKFGKFGIEKTKIIGIIMKELREKSKSNISVQDIRSLGTGYYCEAFLVGDYVLKLGTERKTPYIKNHRRILQPIIRQPLYGENGELDPKMYYIEVQNAVDADWYRRMTDNEAREILYEIYADFRKSGLIWTDIKVSNVGKLRKPNRVNYTFTDTDGKVKDIQPTEEATGIEGDVKEEEILEKGEYVVLDTDFIFEEEKQRGIQLDGLANLFECRYQRELTEEKNDDGR